MRRVINNKIQWQKGLAAHANYFHPALGVWKVSTQSRDDAQASRNIPLGLSR